MIVHAYYPLGEPRVEREAHVLRKAGHQVDVICLRNEGELPYEMVEGIAVHRLPVRRSRRKGLVTQLLEYLAFFWLAFFKVTARHLRKRYHVVQAHNLPDFLVFAALIPRLTGARLIVDLHDLMPEFYASRFGTDLTSRPVRLVMWQEQLSCRFADHVITVSDHWRETLIARGVRPEKCSVVMNVADDRIFKWSPDYAAVRAGDGRFRLIYHGTIVYRYGLDLAMHAVDQLRHEIPEIELVIQGRGDYVETLEQLVAELGLEEHVVIYNGLRPVHELPDFIRKADLGVVAYRDDTFTDGLLPTKLMEYAALGLPAVAARTTAIERYFGDTMVAFFEPGDAGSLAQTIAALYASPERRAELAAGSQKFNARYAWPEIGAHYLALVERLAGVGAAE